MQTDHLSPEELLACPFCGKDSPVRLTTSDDGVEEFDYSNAVSHAVVCDASSENGRGPGGCGAASGYSPTQEGAIKKWNSRK